jgi:hypothetical protein
VTKVPLAVRTRHPVRHSTTVVIGVRGVTRVFHIHVHATRPQNELIRVLSSVGDRELPVLVDFSADGPFLSSFEDTADRLVQLPSLYFEPDGSFVWNRSDTNAEQPVKEHLEGVLYDRNGRVQYCELKGDCSLDALTQFLAALKGETAATVIQLVSEGVFVEEQVFLGWFD